jgi:transposase
MNGMTECTWVGIDVSKAKLDVARLDGKGKIKSHVFNNDAKGFAALLNWLSQRGCTPPGTQICTEATGP